MQITLSKITALGTTETQKQRELRSQINNQKKILAFINQSHTTKIRRDKEPFETQIKGIFNKFGVYRYGCAPVLEDYIFENAVLDNRENIALVFVYPMRYDPMISAPSLDSATEIFRAYAEVGEIVIQLTKVLRSNGYQVTGHHPLGDENEYHHLLFPPHAVHAGLGEQGRTGLFIDHELGPLVRIGVVTIGVDIDPVGPVIKGISEFCKRCLYCVKRCPPHAITGTSYHEFITLGTEIRFKIDGDRCIKYFAKHNGCGRCLVHCVLAKPKLSEISIRMERIGQWYSNWIESNELEKLRNIL